MVLSERIVARNGRGVVGRVEQWRFDTNDEVSVLIPSYCVVAVRDGLIDRFEFFPDDDPAPAVARLDELAGWSFGLEDADPWNEADRITRRNDARFAAGSNDDWLDSLADHIVYEDRRSTVATRPGGSRGGSKRVPPGT